MLYQFCRAIYNTLFCNVNEIVPGIWLGNGTSALDEAFLIESKIDIVVNCTPHIPFSSLDNITYLRIPVNDSLLEKDLLLMEQYFKVLLPILSKQYMEGKRLLIHCHAGKQRSAVLVAGLLYNLQNKQKLTLIQTQDQNKSVSPQDVFTHILSKRPQAFMYGFRVNFHKTFKRYFNI